MKSLHGYSDKHTRMYLKVARALADPEHNSCLSRSIGAVVVKADVPGGRIVSTGYNGPAANLPKPDSDEFLREVVWPQLTDQDRRAVLGLTDASPDGSGRDTFCHRYAGCGQCPRRIVGAPSGQRLELCNCAHAERNAVTRATEPLEGCTMFCWCGVPCGDCATAIVNSGIRHLVCIDWGGDYSPQSRWMLLRAGISIELRQPDTLEMADLLTAVHAAATPSASALGGGL